MGLGLEVIVAKVFCMTTFYKIKVEGGIDIHILSNLILIGNR